MFTNYLSRIKRNVAVPSPQYMFAAKMEEGTVVERDAILDAYYHNNGLYSEFQAGAYQAGIWTPAMLSLRNPAHAVVEFYVAKIWPGQLPKALPIVTTNKLLADAVEKVWKWSNWGLKKSLAVRWFALYGNWFGRVMTKDNSAGEPSAVIIKSIKPCYVTDFKVDDSGFVTWIRIDYPKKSRTNIAATTTEVWDKSSQQHAIYDNPMGVTANLKSLKTPEVHEFSEYGIDFVPIVHAAFFDEGECRGEGAFTHALDEIDEINRMTTRLHQILFRYNKPTIGVFANANDALGRPLPPPKLTDGRGTEDTTSADDDVRLFPGHSSMEFMVPNLQYESYLNAIKDQKLQMEQDLPELAYYRVRDLGANISGRAAITLLDDAISKGLEARGSIESALVRAQQMAITIGQHANLIDAAVGDYETGALDHSFAERPLLRVSDFENSETMVNETKSGVPLIVSAERRGWTSDELDKLREALDKAQAAQVASTAQALAEAERRLREQTSQTSNPNAVDTTGGGTTDGSTYPAG